MFLSACQRLALVIYRSFPEDRARASGAYDLWLYPASPHLQRFRIVAIEPEHHEDAPFHAVWVVEPALS